MWLVSRVSQKNVPPPSIKLPCCRPQFCLEDSSCSRQPVGCHKVTCHSLMYILIMKYSESLIYEATGSSLCGLWWQ